VHIGLNPYGLTFTLGLQGAGTRRANPRPGGLSGFIAIARQIHAEVLELHDAWLLPMSDADLRDLGARLADLGMTPICSHGLAHTPSETLDESIRCARLVGSSCLRLHLTPVLEGARAARGDGWPALVTHARTTLAREAPKAEQAGVALAIEDHQDLGSAELVAFAEEAGHGTGIVLDTGNPFAVGEDPVAFTRRVLPLLRHVHLKDYRAAWTDDGFRLVRCAIGDGCVPFAEIVPIVAAAYPAMTASIEPGALESRHIRLFAPDWWSGYAPAPAVELATALGRLRRRRIRMGEGVETPWERGDPPEVISAYEQEQIARSAAFARRLR
jgi:sugar phosphate isomerase/epimerase